MHTLNLSAVIAKLNLDVRLQDRLSDLVVDEAMGMYVVDGGDLWLYLEELATGEEYAWLNQTDWFPRAEMAEMLFLSHPGATRVNVDA